MSEDIKEIKVTKKPGTAIKFDDTYSSAYRIIDQYVSIFGKYSARFIISHTRRTTYPYGDRSIEDGLRLKINLDDDHGKNQDLELNIGQWIVFMGSDIKIYKDNEFKATFEEQESK